MSAVQSVSGTVRDGEGRRVRGVAIAVFAARPAIFLGTWPLDARGAFHVELGAAPPGVAHDGARLLLCCLRGEDVLHEEHVEVGRRDLAFVIGERPLRRLALPGPLVRGVVSPPTAGIVVKAWAGAIELGAATVERDGQYELRYELPHARRGPLDLVVRAYDRTGREVAASPVHAGALAIAEIDLELPQPAGAAHARVLRDLAAAAGGAGLETLDRARLAAVASAAGIELARARRAVAAERIAKAAGIASEHAAALVEAGAPASPRALLRARPARIAETIASARAAGTLDIDDRAAAALGARLERAAIAHALQDPGTGPRASLYAAIAASGLPVAHQERLVELERREPRTLRTQLAAEPSLDPTARETALYCVDVAALIDHPPIAARVVATRQARRATSVRDLAELDVDDWLALVGTDVPAHVDGVDAAARARTYAEQLTRRFERELPGPFFARRLERDGAQPAAGALRVLDHPDFVLGTTPLGAFVAAHRELFGADASVAERQLQALDRLHRVTPRYAEVRALLDTYDSAAAIARRSQRSFVRRNHAALGTRAAEVYQAAADSHAQAVAMATTFHPSLMHTGVRAIDGLAPPDIASWTTLFGAVDFCSCDHCRSVLGPAAYFVDLLEYLERHDGIGCKLALLESSPWTTRAAPPAGASDDAGRLAFDAALAEATADVVDVLVGHRATVRDLATATRGPVFEARESLSRARPELSWTAAETGLWGMAQIVPQTARDLLLSRRADLGRITLSCDNTNIVVPHIDLVNELLEVDVVRAAGQSVSWPSRIETRGDAADLAIEPQPGPGHDAAEEILAAARYPLTAPYEAWSEETRSVLDHLGVPLHELVHALRGIPTGEHYTRACAQLGLAHAERAFFANPDAPAAVAALWGFDGAIVTVRDPARPGASISGPWLRVLARVSVLMQRTGLTYVDLACVLAGRSMPERASITAVAGAPATTCDTSLLEASSLTAASALHLNKLVRLHRALGWTITDLDKVVFGLGGRIDEAAIVALARIDRLRLRFRRPVLEIAAWWTDLDTFDNPHDARSSYYREVVLSPAVANPPPPGLGPVAFAGGVADHAVALCAAFGISARDVEAILAAEPELADELTLAKVSLIARHASLARALRTSVGDLLALRELAQLDPFGSDPDAAEELVELAQSFARLRLNADDLRYLLRHERLDRATTALPPATASAALLAVDTAIRAVDESLGPAREALALVGPETPIVVGPDGLRDALIAPTRELLAHVLALPLVESALRLIATGASDPETLAAVATIPGLDDAGERLDGPAAIAGASQRLAYVLAALLLHVRTTRATRAIVETLAGVVRLDHAITATLLLAHLRSHVDPGRFAIADFLGDGGAALRLATLERLHKAAVLCQRAALSAGDLRHVLAAPAGTGWLDLGKLPVAPSPADPVLFSGVLHLVELTGVRRRFPGGAAALREVLDLVTRFEQDPAVTREAILAALAERTDWDAADIEQLAAHLAIPLPGGLHDPRALDRLFRAAELLRRLGVSAATAIGWTQLPATPARGRRIAAEVRNAAVARHGRDGWRTAARPLVDRLRERRRDALVAHVIHARGLGDAGELHGRLLVDTEVNACAMTSRIRLAIASVQLFVQRCLLGLERDVELGAEARDEWEWMKAYRVWEANRKVFLWPENWIYPELRADKSDLFDALETEVAAGGLDGASAETAVRHYLEGLVEISRLELLGSYRHRRADTDVFYVVGRDRASPARHYLRTLEHREWSAWTRIDLDITGPHCFPVVMHDRLYLFWSEIEPIPKSRPLPEGGTQYEHPLDDLEIRICWSARRHDGWSTKYRSPALRMPVENVSHSAKNYVNEVFFATRVDGDTLHIRCAAESDYLDSRGAPLIGELAINPAADVATVDLAIDPDVGHYQHGERRVWRLVAPFHGVDHDRIASSRHLALASGTYPPDTWLLPNIDEPWEAIDELAAGAEAHQLLGNRSRGSYRVVVPHQYEQYVSQDLAFVCDDERTLLIEPPGIAVGRAVALHDYRLSFFEHPLARELLALSERGGPHELYAWHDSVQRQSFDVLSRYQPNADEVLPLPRAKIDFGRTGSYAIYNWELFLHVPLLIADRLTRNRRFEEARDWLHAIFDPTFTSGQEIPQRFWNLQPFREAGVPPSIEQLMEEHAAGTGSLDAQIARWRERPFEPHEIAKSRRVAYQKNVVLRYVDNLLAWGDDLFRRDTGEAVDEATLLYLLAAEILGPRPREVRRGQAPDRTYNELAPAIDSFGNALVALEPAVLGARPRFERSSGAMFDRVDRGVVSAHAGRERAPSPPRGRRVPPPRVLYFCIPPNDELLERWDRVADRLFKIRCCMNIDGIRRDLPLFEPPIDPELLVRARAAGLDLGQVTAELSAPLPRVRFTRLLQLAKELTAEVRALGAAILAAREKRDAEALAGLRAGHELAILDTVRATRRAQIDEARQQLAALQAQRATIERRAEAYRTRESLNTLERRYAEATAEADDQSRSAAGLMANAANITGMTVLAGMLESATGGPHQLSKIVDNQLIQSMAMAMASSYETEAGAMRSAASMHAVHAGYQRRQEEWDLQVELAELELGQIDRQLLAAEIRIAITEAELATHERQRAHAREVDDQLRHKFTGAALYEWLSAQLGAVYFQAYDLAADVARKAERAFQYELGRLDARFVEATHWDSFHKGLLAGERLARDLQRMEAAHLDLRARELELRRHVSLALHDPASLIALKATGECVVVVPEALFDADYPGHYFRRLRRVAISIPCVVGPYGTVNCTLTLLDDALRVEPRHDDSDAALVRRSGAPIESIVTSSGTTDGGSLELAPLDQLMPFEGAGAISRWRIELPADTNDFDLGELTDVILRLDYTARDGGEAFRASARARLDDLRSRVTEADGGLVPRLQQLFSLKHQLPMEWRAFLAAAANGAATVELPLTRDRFPFLFRGRDLAIDGATVAWLSRRPQEPSDEGLPRLDLELAPPGTPPVAVDGLDAAAPRTLAIGNASPGVWRLTSTRAFDARVVEDLLLSLQFTVGPSQ